MDPIDLIFAHRYSEARAVYEARLKRRPDNGGYLGGHALSLLCLGQDLEQALGEFRRVNAMAAETMAALGGKTQPELEQIGVVQWLLGRRREATATFRFGAEGILSGSIEYADNAGGASHGLLLWYAGVTTADKEVQQFAVKYFERLAREESYGQYGRFYWPQPLPLFLLGRLDADQVLLGLVGTTNSDEAIRRANELSKNNKAIRHNLAQALFYLAAQKRACGDEAGCGEGMARCAGMENPILAVEWYLARAEAGYVPGRKDWPWPAATKKARRGRK